MSSALPWCWGYTRMGFPCELSCWNSMLPTWIRTLSWFQIKISDCFGRNSGPWRKSVNGCRRSTRACQLTKAWNCPNKAILWIAELQYLHRWWKAQCNQALQPFWRCFQNWESIHNIRRGQSRWPLCLHNKHNPWLWQSSPCWHWSQKWCMLLHDRHPWLEEAWHCKSSRIHSKDELTSTNCHQ